MQELLILLVPLLISVLDQSYSFLFLSESEQVLKSDTKQLLAEG